MSSNEYPAVEMRDVSLSFKGVIAVSKLSFSVKRGEICALIGPNGAGKSSVLNILNGVYQADQGDVFYSGRLAHKLAPLDVANLGRECKAGFPSLCRTLK